MDIGVPWNEGERYNPQRFLKNFKPDCLMIIYLKGCCILFVCLFFPVPLVATSGTQHFWSMAKHPNCKGVNSLLRLTELENYKLALCVYKQIKRGGRKLSVWSAGRYGILHEVFAVQMCNTQRVGIADLFSDLRSFVS